MWIIDYMDVCRKGSSFLVGGFRGSCLWEVVWMWWVFERVVDFDIRVGEGVIIVVDVIRVEGEACGFFKGIIFRMRDFEGRV